MNIMAMNCFANIAMIVFLQMTLCLFCFVYEKHTIKIWRHNFRWPVTTNVGKSMEIIQVYRNLSIDISTVVNHLNNLGLVEEV